VGSDWSLCSKEVR